MRMDFIPSDGGAHGIGLRRAMKIEYFPETDSLYIDLADRPGADVREIGDLCNADVSEFRAIGDDDGALGRRDHLAFHLRLRQVDIGDTGLRVDAVTSVVDDGVDGLLVMPDDPGDLAQAICELLENKERRMEMGAAGRRKVHERYTWDIVVEKCRKVYQGAGSRKA